MFKINDDKSIYMTRGDAVSFSVTATENGEGHKFRPGDVVRFKVSEKKDCDSVVLQKDVLVATETEIVNVSLSSAETKIGELVHKPTDYWYEVEVNPDTFPQTIIGYDEDGPKVLKLFPEAKDLDKE